MVSTWPRAPSASVECRIAFGHVSASYSRCAPRARGSRVGRRDQGRQRIFSTRPSSVTASSRSRRVVGRPSALAPSFHRMRSRSGGRPPRPGATSQVGASLPAYACAFVELYLSRLEERLVIAQHSADGSRIPPNFTGPRHTSHLLKTTADFTQADTIDADPAED
jgi:hypothetical protein